MSGFSGRLKQFRKEQRPRQKDLAAMLGVAQTAATWGLVLVACRIRCSKLMQIILSAVLSLPLIPFRP